MTMTIYKSGDDQKWHHLKTYHEHGNSIIQAFCGSIFDPVNKMVIGHDGMRFLSEPHADEFCPICFKKK